MADENDTNTNTPALAPAPAPCERSLRKLGTTLLAAALGAACSSAATPATSRGHGHGHGHGHGQHRFADADTWSQVFDDPARDDWQRPGEILRALELEPNMTVADIGAGTGYFSVRLARAVPQGEVIATDIEPDMVRFLNERAHREGLTNLRGLLATHTTSGLAPRSVDRILLVHVWHHLDGDRAAYARDLAAALEPGGRVLIVEFQLSAQRGPPKEMRVPPEAVIASLEHAGLSATLAPVDLPEQYVVQARSKP